MFSAQSILYTFATIFYLQIRYTICMESSELALSEIIKKSITSCDQNEDCKDIGVPGSFVPDPQDCHKYYVCVIIDSEIVASDSSVSCSNGQYFNSNYSMCIEEVEPCVNPCNDRCTFTCLKEMDVIPYRGDCSLYEICLFGGGTELERCPSDKPYFSGDECTDDYSLCCNDIGNTCSLSCTNEMDLIPYPENCHLYQICLIGGGIEVRTCPDDRPYFNGIDCTINSSQCCSFCTLNCDEIGIQIPDPCNCNMFYICVDLGVPTEDFHEHCAEGEHFDKDKGACIAESDCEPICKSELCTSTNISTEETATATATTKTIARSTIITTTKTTATKTAATITTATKTIITTTTNDGVNPN